MAEHESTGADSCCATGMSEINWLACCEEEQQEQQDDYDTIDSAEHHESTAANVTDIQKSTLHFYNANKNNSYEMYKIPRGLAYIINVQFKGKLGDRTPKTDQTAVDLERLFKALHFTTFVVNDDDGLSAQEIETKVKDFGKNGAHRGSQCAILVMLSHGAEGYIVGTDGKPVFDAHIKKCLSDQEAPLLKNIPKVIIRQACRKVHPKRKEIRQMLTEKEDALGSVIFSDYVFAFATQTAHLASRDLYCDTLIDVLTNESHNTDLLAMLQNINGRVKEKRRGRGAADAMSQPEAHNGLTNALFFFPGIDIQQVKLAGQITDASLALQKDISEHLEYPTYKQYDFVIVRARKDIDGSKKFMDKINGDADGIFHDEGFGGILETFSAIYNRTTFVIFYITDNFIDDNLLQMVKNETVMKWIHDDHTKKFLIPVWVVNPTNLERYQEVSEKCFGLNSLFGVDPSCQYDMDKLMRHLTSSESKAKKKRRTDKQIAYWLENPDKIRN